MQLIPYVGTAPVRSDSFSIVVDPRDEERLNALASQASGICWEIHDTEDFEQAVAMVKKLKSLLAEVEDAKRMAMRPFAAVEEAIRLKAKEVTALVTGEHKRLRSLCDAYVAEQEARQKAEQIAKDKAHREEQARLQAELEKARKEAQKAAEAVRYADDSLTNAQLGRLQEKAEDAARKAQLADLEKSLAADIAEMDQAAKPKVPEGGIRHTYEFTLVNVAEVLQLEPVQVRYLKILRWELDKLACNDVVKSQLLVNPDAEPRIPGVEIKRKTSIYTRSNV